MAQNMSKLDDQTAQGPTEHNMDQHCDSSLSNPFCLTYGFIYKTSQKDTEKSKYSIKTMVNLTCSILLEATSYCFPIMYHQM
jgi:hypothetical protein